MQLNQLWRRALRIIGIGILTGLSVVLYLRYGPRQTPRGQPPFVRLNSDNFHVLIERFNAGRDGSRVVVMLSPT